MLIESLAKLSEPNIVRGGHKHDEEAVYSDYHTLPDHYYCCRGPILAGDQTVIDLGVLTTFPLTSHKLPGSTQIKRAQTMGV